MARVLEPPRAHDAGLRARHDAAATGTPVERSGKCGAVETRREDLLTVTASLEDSGERDNRERGLFGDIRAGNEDGPSSRSDNGPISVCIASCTKANIGCPQGMWRRRRPAPHRKTYRGRPGVSLVQDSARRRDHALPSPKSAKPAALGVLERGPRRVHQALDLGHFRLPWRWRGVGGEPRLWRPEIVTAALRPATPYVAVTAIGERRESPLETAGAFMIAGLEGAIDRDRRLGCATGDGQNTARRHRGTSAE